MGGSRKFLLAIGIVLVAGVLCGLNKVAGPEFANILITTVLAFSGANAGEHIAKAWGNKPVIEEEYEQLDISKLVAELLKFDIPTSDGRMIEGLIKEK